MAKKLFKVFKKYTPAGIIGSALVGAVKGKKKTAATPAPAETPKGGPIVTPLGGSAPRGGRQPTILDRNGLSATLGG